MTAKKFPRYQLRKLGVLLHHCCHQPGHTGMDAAGSQDLKQGKGIQPQVKEVTRTGTDEKPSRRTSHLTWPHFLFPSLNNTLRIPPVHLTLHLKPLTLTRLQQNGKALKLGRKWIPRALAPGELLVRSYQGSPCIRES